MTSVLPFVVMALVWAVVSAAWAALLGRRKGDETARSWSVTAGDDVYADAPPGVVGAAVRRSTSSDRSVPVAVRFDPPVGIGPPHVGPLLVETARGRDIASIVISLVVKGHLRMRRVQGRKPLIGKAPMVWELEGVYAPDAAPMTDEEAVMRQALPLPGTRATLPDLKTAIRPAARRLREGLASEQVSGAWRRGTSGVPPFVRRLLVLLSLPFVALVLAIAVTTAELGWGLVCAVVAGVLLGTASRLPDAGRSRTALGSALTYQVQAFREYLRTAEGAQLRLDEGAAIFSGYLPWAVALGVTTEWTKAFREAAAAADPAMYAAWSGDLTWYGDLGSLDVGGLGDLGAVDLSDLGGIGDSFSDFADSLADFASDVDSFSSDLSSDFGGDSGGGGDFGGGDGGGGDGGGGGD